MNIRTDDRLLDSYLSEFAQEILKRYSVNGVTGGGVPSKDLLRQFFVHLFQNSFESRETPTQSSGVEDEIYLGYDHPGRFALGLTDARQCVSVF